MIDISKISLDSREKLRKKWGDEIVLKCSCGYQYSHTLAFQYPAARCSFCKNICEVILEDWDTFNGRS